VPAAPFTARERFSFRGGTNSRRLGIVVPPARETTVLVVEDDPALRTFYRTTLRIVGYTVISVEDGIDALRWLRATSRTWSSSTWGYRVSAGVTFRRN
jgi:hypothetical protein